MVKQKSDRGFLNHHLVGQRDLFALPEDTMTEVPKITTPATDRTVWRVETLVVSRPCARRAERGPSRGRELPGFPPGCSRTGHVGAKGEPAVVT